MDQINDNDLILNKNDDNSINNAFITAFQDVLSERYFYIALKITHENYPSKKLYIESPIVFLSIDIDNNILHLDICEDHKIEIRKLAKYLYDTTGRKHKTIIDEITDGGYLEIDDDFDNKDIDINKLAEDIYWHCKDEHDSDDDIKKMINNKDKFIWVKLVRHGHTELFDNEDDMLSWCQMHADEIFKALQEYCDEHLD